jgi:hypothetical protein
MMGATIIGGDASIVAGALDEPADHDRLKPSAGDGDRVASDSNRPSFGGSVPPGK